MPQSAKPAPPQQASLSELWKKGDARKQRHVLGSAPAEETSAHPNGMDIDTTEAATSSQPAPTIMTAGAPTTLCTSVFC